MRTAGGCGWDVEDRDKLKSRRRLADPKQSGGR